jgi:hypothetical protein
MKSLVFALPALVGLLAAAPLQPTAAAEPDTAGVAAGASHSPPYVDHTEWTNWGRLTSLRVYPTPSARAASREPGTAGSLNDGVQGVFQEIIDEAWTEVLTRSPDADTPGMRAQFVCHWRFAELAQPGKTSWNLEPWRPVVDDAQMVVSGCNPGGSEEPF